MLIQFHPTHAASAIAHSRFSLERVKTTAREEIDSLMKMGLGGVENLVFHSFEIDDVEFVIFPNENDESTLIIDLCEREEILITNGPRAGRIMSTPKPESE